MEIGAFDSFFDCLDENIAAGRGFSVFKATRAQAAAFQRACASRNIPAELLTLSEPPANPNPPAPGTLLIVWQPLPYPSFAAQAETFVQQILYPRWLRRQPVCFFSALPRTAYESPLTAKTLHDEESARRGLLVEQALALLDAPHAPQPVEDAGLAHIPLDPALDANQRQAVTHMRGPIRVLAPAGSGKTRTLTNRVINLLNRGVPAARILALAFNRKAAEEMTERLAARGVSEVNIRTFHALGYEIVREHLGWVYEESGGAGKLSALLEKAVRQHIPLPRRERASTLARFAEALTRTKMDLPPLADITVRTGEEQVAFAPIFQTFLRLQAREQLLNFDDMIYQALRALLDDAALRRQRQKQFTFVLVDEFQDLNRAQMLLLRMLAMPQDNLFVVGDDDQMIYGWRGADVRHMLDFPQQYPAAREVILSTNYRSTRRVVQHASWLIAKNPERVAKNIQPRADAGRGAVEVALGEDLWAQARQAAAWIAHTKAAHGLAWHDFAVLFRSNALATPVALALDQQGVPHMPVNPARLFLTSVGGDVSAYLTALLHPSRARQSDFQRMFRRPNLFLPGEVLRQVASWEAFCNPDSYAGLADWHREKALRFVEIIRGLAAVAWEAAAVPHEILLRLRTDLDLAVFYRAQDPHLGALDQSSEEVIFEALAAVAQGYGDAEAFHFAIRQAHAAARRGADLQGDGEQPARPAADNPRGVALFSIHKAKGKEFPNVVYFDLSRQVSPNAQEAAEERRVAYVGVTRAEERLLVTADRARPSPFVRELALNPAWEGYARPYVARQLGIARRQCARLKKQATGKGLLARFRAGLGAQARQALPDARARVEVLEDEVRFREVLGIED